MWVRFAALVSLVPLLGAPACGGDGGEKTVGEPCTRTAECAEDLECVGGICAARSSDATVDRG